MNIIDNTIATTELSFRERSHRYSALPVKDILKIQMKDLGLKNKDMQKALDYAMPNVIAMIRGGTMQLPPSKAIIAANLLKIDPVFLLGKVIAENDPALWDVISELMADKLVTVNEMSLLKMVRLQLDGHDVDLVESPDFMASVVPALNVIRERQNALALAAINRTDE